MTQTFRCSMQWLHTWTGLVGGWVIFLIFFNGSAAYFRQEITTWMKPEVAATVDARKSVLGAVAFLKVKAPHAESWMITVPDRRHPVSDVSWKPRPVPGESAEDDDDDEPPPLNQRATVDSDGRLLGTRDTDGGDYFFQFHFALHYLPLFLGSLVVGVAGLCLIVALTTGLIIHRGLFKNLFKFRSTQGARFWLDAHTTFAVVALPFHVMISYSGVAILMFFFMPWAVFVTHSNPRAYYAQLLSKPEMTKPTGHEAQLVPISTVLDAAEAIWKSGRAERIRIINPDDASSIIIVDRHSDGIFTGADSSLSFDGVTGALRHPSIDAGVPETLGSTVFNLHQAHFAGPWLRFCLFACGSLSTGMVASGLLLWIEKRRRKSQGVRLGSSGFPLVDAVNIAVLAGYPAATAVLFWANRLLPSSLNSRSDKEILCAFCCWILLLVFSLCRPTREAWTEVFCVAAALYGFLPVMNAYTSQRGTFEHLISGDPLYLGFDIVSFILGLGFAFAAWFMKRSSTAAALP